MRPFSGLTLIIHLIIIGIGKTIDFFQGKFLSNKSKPTALKQKADYLLAFDKTFSIAVILLLSTLMLIFFSVALNTSIREGADEWHRRQLKQAWVYMANDLNQLKNGVDINEVMAIFTTQPTTEELNIKLNKN